MPIRVFMSSGVNPGTKILEILKTVCPGVFEVLQDYFRLGCT